MTKQELLESQAFKDAPMDYEVIFFVDNDEAFTPKYDVDDIDVNHKKRQIELY